MQTNFRLIVICAIISLFLYTGKANAAIKLPITDTICCAPDSLKVISTNFPIFCVSWRVSVDSNCKSPYGFEIQWKQLGTFLWYNKIISYSGGVIVNFCDSVSVCGNYQWRVRTICDTIGGYTYSDWIYGNKFSMVNCLVGGLNFTKDLKNKQKPVKDKSTISNQAIKRNEN
jgi:hypothetical protein